MQELLTGKRRLPGFEGEWEVKALKDIVKTPITDGPHMTPRFLDIGVPFLSVNNLVNNRIDLSDLRFISEEDHRTFSRKCKPQRVILRLRAAGWWVELVYLSLPSVQLSVQRVAERVAHGGHNVPLPVLQRRFPRSIRLLLNTYAPAVDQAICNMNDGETPKPVFFQAGLERTIVDATLYTQLLELAR